MNFRQIIVHQTFPNDIEEARKGSIQNSHSTDTEPEVDTENSPNIFHSLNLSSSNEVKQKRSNIKCIKGHKIENNVFKQFYEGIPTFEYDQKIIKRNQLKKKSKIKNPFHKIEMKNNRFLNYFDAFLNIADHCQKNNQKFTRDNCKEYLKDCYIIDFKHDGYVPITPQLPQRQFNKYYREVQRELKYL